MDQGLGLKNTHPVDDLASSSDVRISKDNSGPVYESEETEEAFILTAHLKGYRKEHVDIDYSEDRTRIIIGLEKPVQEKKKKVFRIPDGVDSSRIKAKFDDELECARIDMPKVKKGYVGARVEEVKEDVVPEKDGEKLKGVENPREIRDSKHEEVKKKKKEVDERERSEKGKGKDVGGESTPEKKPAAIEKSNLLRTPLIIVGSALLVSIVLLAINRIRNRKKR